MQPATKYAQVIVDVKTMQTNQPYTYRVPEELAQTIQVGVRVVVPFGRRRVQGFVWRLGGEELAPVGVKLKAIASQQDLTPVVTPEGMQLAAWLAQNNLAFVISCLQVQLPQLLRADYQKQLIIDRSHVPAVLADLVTPSHTATEVVLALAKHKLTPEQTHAVVQLLRQKQARVHYVVANQAKAKQQLWVKPAITADQMQQVQAALPARNRSQHKLLTYLLAAEKFDEWQLRSHVQTAAQVSASTVTTAVTKGWLEQAKRQVARNPFTHLPPADQPKQLQPDQLVAKNQVEQAINAEQATPFLLEGVTGSGKTEVYLQVMAAALARGKTALMLVPEIALTPQMVQRVTARFGKRVAVLHSALNAGEKFDEWQKIRTGKAQVVIGARSAVFAPLDNLGVIILDEEHESSYKQSDMPRYHARDVALWRGRFHHCPVVLGSATPSLESRARAVKGVYHLLRLPHRINHQKLPDVTVVDIKQALTQVTDPSQMAVAADLTPPLLTALNECLANGHQAVLLLNRRGYAASMQCRQCGAVLQCPNCDISLTVHQVEGCVKCHYCGFQAAIPQVCPQCHSRRLRKMGTGTQKVAAELKQVLPDASVLRIDNDTTRKKGALAHKLAQFADKKAQILLGTQMIAKGLDYPNVTLVGVINADTGLAFPDYRAAERTFQLLTQVAGRAGRGDVAGKVIIQTYNADHYAIQLAAKQDYERFFVTEMQMRHQTNYPPYFYTLQITASSKDANAAAQAMFGLMGKLRRQLSNQAIVLGPTAQPLIRLKQRYFYQVVIKYKHEPQLMQYLQRLIENVQKQTRYGVQITIDKDPQTFL